MTENSFRDKYERYMTQDPGNADVRRKALTAVAAKMARVAYALVKRFQRGLPSPRKPAANAPARHGSDFQRLAESREGCCVPRPNQALAVSTLSRQPLDRVRRRHRRRMRMHGLSFLP
jgi:hypothetical protein